MFGVFSSSPASVLTSATEMRRVLADIAAVEPALALTELTGWIEATLGSTGLDTAQQINLLYQFDGAARLHLRKIESEFISTHDAPEDSWRTARDYWVALSAAYEAMLSAAETHRAEDPSAASGFARLGARTLRAWRQRLKWDYLHNGPLDESLWQAIGMAYLSAVRLGTEHRDVLSAADEIATTVEREYLQTIALHVAAPEGLSAPNISMVEFLTGHFSADFSLTPRIERTSTHWLDANQPQPPLRLVRAPMLTEGMRFFSAVEAAQACATYLEVLESGATVSQLFPDMQLDVDALKESLRHLASCWALDPPTRMHRRHQLGGQLSVANGVKHLHHVLRGVRDDAVIYRWELADASLGGIGATAPTASAEWVRVGSLVGMQPDDGGNWLVGVVRRYLRGRDAKGMVGIQTLSSQATPLEVFSERNSGEAVALDEPVTGAVIRLAVNGTGYSGDTLHASINGRHVRLDPVELIERGRNFDLGRFRVSDFR